MNILINKDIETEYKDEFINGFTLREAVCIGAGVLVVVGTALFCKWKWGIEPNAGCYFGLPVAGTIIFMGFKKFQALTPAQYLKEILWEKRTRTLTYSADEMEEDTEPFTLEKGRRKKR